MIGLVSLSAPSSIMTSLMRATGRIRWLHLPKVTDPLPLSSSLSFNLAFCNHFYFYLFIYYSLTAIGDSGKGSHKTAATSSYQDHRKPVKDWDTDGNFLLLLLFLFPFLFPFGSAFIHLFICRCARMDEDRTHRSELHFLPETQVQRTRVA